MSSPQCPYHAVIFTSKRTDGDEEAYVEMAERMFALVESMPGYLGRDTAPGINISYWESAEAIANWRANAEHQAAQAMGNAKWYASYRLRYCLVERDHEAVLR